MFNPLQVNKLNTQVRLLSFVIASIALLLFVELAPSPATPAAQAGSNASLAVFPINSNPYGMSYAQWSARWWQWVLSIPAATNPALADGDVDCAAYQSGLVWYLAGTFAGPAERRCSIPAGKALFFPVLAAAFGAGFGDCNGPADCDVKLLRDGAASWMDNPQLLSASLDGDDLPNLPGYRVQSPVFGIVVPDDGLVAPGPHTPDVSDGYWLMMRPLTPGNHTLTFKAITNFGFAVDVTYHLTIR
jgi:hypothetical protein